MRLNQLAKQACSLLVQLASSAAVIVLRILCVLALSLAPTR